MGKHLTICLIARSYPPLVGGMENYATSLHNALQKRAKVIKISSAGGKISLPFFLVGTFLRVLFVKADLYQMCDGLTALLAPAIKIFKKKPVITTVHGLDVTCGFPLYQSVVIPCIAMSDKIVAVSENTRYECTRRRIAGNKIEVIANGLDFSRYPLLKDVAKDPDMMITVGRQIKRKGVADFIETKLKQMMHKHPRLKFYIIGTGPEKRKILRAIANCRFRDRIFYLGRLEDSGLFHYYRKASFFAASNIHVEGDVEGFGIAILEAIFYQNIVLANPIEGLKDALKFTRNWIDLNRQPINLEIKHHNEPLLFSWNRLIEKYFEVYAKAGFSKRCQGCSIYDNELLIN